MAHLQMCLPSDPRSCQVDRQSLHWASAMLVAAFQSVAGGHLESTLLALVLTAVCQLSAQSFQVIIASPPSAKWV